MGRITQAFLGWLERWDLRAIDDRIQAHFADINPETITDIDKYLRSQGLMP